jgi:plasmid stabilization system protein ParE
VARVEVARTAAEDLARLISVLSLPADTRERFRACVEPLRTFPRLGPELGGRWHGLRFILGPWRWMVVVYAHPDDEDRVVIVTIRDVRSSDAPSM